MCSVWIAHIANHAHIESASKAASQCVSRRRHLECTILVWLRRCSCGSRVGDRVGAAGSVLLLTANHCVFPFLSVVNCPLCFLVRWFPRGPSQFHHSGH